MRRADGVVLRGDEYRLIRELFADRFGIQLAPEARMSVERRLRERLGVRGHASFLEYYQFLKWNPAAGEEIDEAVELLTTHETYFFREDYQLRAFRDELLPMLAELAKTRRRLAIWSAGCSTGEEAYTIAIIVRESGLFEGWDVRVYGSDVSKRCVAAARRGVYGPGAFRTTPDASRDAYFVRKSDGFHVVDAIRAMCHFGQVNLLDDERTRLVGRVDAIFCRNVLIYLEQSARRRVIDMFQERLFPGGVLLLGHSESLLNVSTAFELLHLREDLVYKKPLGNYPSLPSDSSRVQPPSSASPKTPPRE
jgi:chemotaxis protein methyltransferase CheR